MTLRILSFLSDTDGCYYFRCAVPYRELKRFDVEVTEYCFLPNQPEIEQSQMLLEMISQFDLVIIQRCYLFGIVKTISTVCQFLGKPLIFEVDDDYISLIPSNPAFFAIADDQDLFKRFYEAQQAGNVEVAQELLEPLLESRARGLAAYKELLKLPDWITTSTEELARTIRPYNKNVVVFQNNVEKVFPWRDSFDVRNALYEHEGSYKINVPNTLGLFTIPNFERLNETTVRKIPRIGYTGTPSHASEDWLTINKAINEYHTEHASVNDHALVMLGDPYFYHQIENKNLTFHIPPTTPYEKYMFNLRNIDVMLCPLSPTPFNMSKSDIKLVEAAAWGSCGLAPRFITYTRNFVEEETTLFYSSPEEFKDQLDRLVKDMHLRERLGKNSLDYVASCRLERQHSERRYEFYKSVIAGKKPLSIFESNKETVNAG